MDLGPVMSVIIAMETGRTFVPFGFGGYADNILYAGTEEQKQRYLIPTIEGERRSCFAITEPGAGSDARAIRTRAVKDGSDWIINGEKTFITNGNEADFTMVFAVNNPELGAAGGVTCFLVDRDMGWKSEPIPTMGEWGPAALVFEDVRVPEENILGEVGRGFELAMKWIGQGRYMIPARAIGSAERMLQMAIDYAKIRKSMGNFIADYQAIQWQIADSAVEIESAKWLTLYAAWRVQAGLDSRQASSISKLQGGLMANQVVDRVLQIHGGMGYTKELPIERWYRELRLLRIFEGTDEIQRRTIARNLIKGHAQLGGSGNEPAAGRHCRGRRVGAGKKTPHLTVFSQQAQASAAALAEAGLGFGDVEGLFVAGAGSWSPPLALAEYLGLQPKYLDGTNIGGSSFEAHLGHATAAIEAGLIDVALITYGSTQRTDRSRNLPRAASLLEQYERPFGLPTPVGAYALAANRYMYEYGVTSEQLAEVAVSARAWAGLNPKAYYRDPITVEDVLASDLICEPLHKLDCCLVTDGGGAVVVAAQDRWPDVAPAGGGAWTRRNHDAPGHRANARPDRDGCGEIRAGGAADGWRHARRLRRGGDLRFLYHHGAFDVGIVGIL